MKRIIWLILFVLSVSYTQAQLEKTPNGYKYTEEKDELTLTIAWEFDKQKEKKGAMYDRYKYVATLRSSTYIYRRHNPLTLNTLLESAIVEAEVENNAGTWWHGTAIYVYGKEKHFVGGWGWLLGFGISKYDIGKRLGKRGGTRKNKGKTFMKAGEEFTAVNVKWLWQDVQIVK